MTNKPFDFTKPVKARDGRPARIICTDRKSREKPILYLYTQEDGVEIVRSVSTSGKASLSRYDLVNLPEKTERYYTLNRHTLTLCHDFDHARTLASYNVNYKIVKITYEDDVPVSIEQIET